MIYIGERLKKLRTDSNLTQKELSELLGVGISTICFYESDTRKPSYEILIKYASHFHVSTDYILMADKRVYYDVTDLTLEDREKISFLITQYKTKKDE